METPSPSFMSPDANLINATVAIIVGDFMDKLQKVLIANIVYMSVIFSIEFPMILLAISAVCSLIKSNQAAPIFIINLLISDLIQIVAFVLFYLNYWAPLQMISFFWPYFSGLYFMMCIAVERCLLIAHPIWQRSHRSVKCLVCTSLAGWLASFVFCLVYLLVDSLVLVVSFVYYIVIVVCFVEARRSLSNAMSLAPLKRQMVLASLMFVLLSYTLLILPFNILLIVHLFIDLPRELQHSKNFYMLNPLMNCLLYVFMRSDAENIVPMPRCCFGPKKDQSQREHIPSTVAQHDCVRFTSEIH